MPVYRNIGAFLSNPRTQAQLGVDIAALGPNGTFNNQSPTVNAAFRAHLDHYGFPAQYYIAALLERGVRALVYVGATDYICNWVRGFLRSWTTCLCPIDTVHGCRSEMRG